jgi:hypothetical protein
MEVYPLTDQGYGADEQLAQLFTPHTILPSQFFRGPAWCAGLQGEQRLMLAVLEDAIHVYCKESATPGRRNSWLFREAEGAMPGRGDERLDTDGLRNGIGDRR